MKDTNGSIQIGRDCFFNNGCSINCNNQIVIGNGSLFGENVKIYDHNHRFNKDELIKNQGFSNGKVSIGNHCWIGSNVVILKNTIINDNCVIGAGCIISGEIPENTIVKTNSNYKLEKINKNK